MHFGGLFAHQFVRIETGRKKGSPKLRFQGTIKTHSILKIATIRGVIRGVIQEEMCNSKKGLNRGCKGKNNVQYGVIRDVSVLSFDGACMMYVGG